MEMYKENGEWKISQWEGGQKHVTKEDGHTYTQFEDGSVGHVHCDCLNK
jgi:hypothetical protein